MWVLLLLNENGNLLAETAESKKELEDIYVENLLGYISGYPLYDLKSTIEQIKELNYKYLIIEIDEQQFKSEVSFLRDNPGYLKRINDYIEKRPKPSNLDKVEIMVNKRNELIKQLEDLDNEMAIENIPFG